MSRLCIHTLLVFGWFVMSGCAVSDPQEASPMPETDAYRQELYRSVDRVADLAARLDRLQSQRERAFSETVHPSETGSAVLQDVLETTQRFEHELRRRISKLEKELNK